MRTKRLLFALCSRARLCYPRFAGSGAAPHGDPPRPPCCHPRGPVAARTGFAHRHPQGPHVAGAGMRRGRARRAGACKKPATDPGQHRGSAPEAASLGLGQRFCLVCFFYFWLKKKNMWMRCRGADHSPGSMVGKEWDLVTLVGPFQMGISCDPKRDEETNTEPPHAITWPQ